MMNLEKIKHLFPLKLDTRNSTTVLTSKIRVKNRDEYSIMDGEPEWSERKIVFCQIDNLYIDENIREAIAELIVHALNSYVKNQEELF